jgi:hypothetical protein
MEDLGSILIQNLSRLRQASLSSCAVKELYSKRFLQSKDMTTHGRLGEK